MLQRSEAGRKAIDARYWSQVHAEKGERKMNGTNGEILELAPNEPQLVAIKYAQPKIVSNGRAMFSLVDGRLLFLDPPIAEKIIALGVRTGEPFAICLRWSGKKSAPKTYDVWRESDAAEPEPEPTARFGPQRDGTYAVPAVPAVAPPAESTMERQLRESIERGKACLLGPNGNGGSSDPLAALRQQAQALIDVFADCLTYSGKYGAAVKPDDVRSIVLSCFINKPKGGTQAA